MAKKLTNEEFIERIRKIHKTEIKVLGIYKNKRTKVLVKHKCGYEWEANPESLWSGSCCPLCSNNLRKTTDKFKSEISSLSGTEYEIIGEYINSSTPILFKHNLCGKTFKMRPTDFLKGQRCPYERYKKSANSNTINFNIIKENVEQLGKGDYKIIGEYRGASKKAKFFHVSCGNYFYMEPTRFINGGIRCPHCYRSKGEEVIREYLNENKFDFKEQYKIKECKNKRPLPFDFAIFKKSEIKCLIEYDGSQHFMPKFNCSKEDFQKIKYNDEIKNEFCKKNNIPLIRIKYVRSENLNIIKNKIIKKLEDGFEKINMGIPSEASLETTGTCND
ncbi:DUF2726 domain-containing protein [Clostridioides difficile]|uniref:DUF2726 domain-containing protein n=4 Tax=Clostridioides difficile TaxID=1496 RepID=UPI00038D1D21|nr:DUF2726 domain-containing protein [Clostridioides difficile]EGT3757670.1 DUF2726 domain-containing protein [Clostridioides difficile]EGT3910192.1 DUF2726 domain-containing protein [Clostridioides difficile]EGT4159428.1 DUF2726 domain-containing protein [Clostridioides difficile]EGT4583766.1 DUF2726 domain-containing protein [Clostridioides difficile]EGT4635080.1 DUF2726 domain-containing protein [Clostridioides difficile]